jgi:hypothetical protein
VYGNNITTAAIAMKNLQVASCPLADSKGSINGQLAPAARPNPGK